MKPQRGITIGGARFLRRRRIRHDRLRTLDPPPLGQHRQRIVLRARQPFVQRRQRRQPPIFTHQPVGLARRDCRRFDRAEGKHPMEHVSAEPRAQGEQRVVPPALER